MVRAFSSFEGLQILIELLTCRTFALRQNRLWENYLINYFSLVGINTDICFDSRMHLTDL